MGCLLPLDFVIPYLFRRFPMGIRRTDAHVIRNAGGRASDDANRSLVISYKLLGTREFFVVHHTDCGMEFFTNEVMRGLLASSLETAELTSNGFRDVGHAPGSTAKPSVRVWLSSRTETASVLRGIRRCQMACHRLNLVSP